MDIQKFKVFAFVEFLALKVHAYVWLIWWEEIYTKTQKRLYFVQQFRANAHCANILDEWGQLLTLHNHVFKSIHSKTLEVE